MITKTYKAHSLTEAISMIKQEMGSKASILSTKSTPARNTLFKTVPAQIEVLAGIDEKYLTQQQIELIRGGILNSILGSSKKKSKTGGLFSVASQVLENSDQGVSVNVANQKTEDDKFVAEFKKMREKLKTLEDENDKLKKQLSEIQETQSEIEKFKLPEKNLSTTKTETFEVIPELSAKGRVEKLKEARDEVANRLLQQGISQESVAEWLEQCRGFSGPSRFEDVEDNAISFFMDHFLVLDSLPKVAAFVGVNGCGKSTAIAKLALKLKNEGKRVAILTLDVTDYKTFLEFQSFAQKNQIPFVAIRQNKYFDKSLHEFAEYDHVLVDTYSVNPQDKTSIKRLMSRMGSLSIPTVQVIDVCRLDARTDVDVFRDYEIHSIFFSHMDVQSSFAPLFELQKQRQLPALAFGFGKTVKDYVEFATSERAVANLFGLDEETSDSQNNLVETGESI